jgi:hypothetical protein
VLVGIETDRVPWVAALVAAGYQVFAVNPGSWPATGSGTAPRGLKATPPTRTLWPTWCAPTPASCARGHRAGRGDQGGGPGTPEHDLGPDPACAAAALDTAGILPVALEAFPDLAAPDALELLAEAPDPLAVATLSRNRIVRNRDNRWFSGPAGLPFVLWRVMGSSVSRWCVASHFWDSGTVVMFRSAEFGCRGTSRQRSPLS